MLCLASTSSASTQNSVFALTLLLLLGPFVLPPTLLAQAASDLKIEYTGKLFGYYRIEAKESIEARSDEGSELKLKPVRALLAPTSISNSLDPDALLLGMGDNFAPEFGASIQQEFQLQNDADKSSVWAPCNLPASSGPPKSTDPKQWHRSAPEALYKSHERVPAMADCDNVTRFLMTAGYRAIVPGREDFIYSGTWLRSIALLLNNASSDQSPINPIPKSHGKWTFGQINSADHKLHILAANIRVKVADSKVKTTAVSCPLLFARDLTIDTPCASFDSAITTEMDWLRRLDQSLDPSVEISLKRQASQDSNFRAQLIKNQTDIVSSLRIGYHCGALPDASKPTAKSDEMAHKKTLQDLNSPDNAAVCDGLNTLLGEAGAGDLLGPELRKREISLFLRLIAQEQKNAGYTIASLHSGRKVLIIGVVGQETMQEISKWNFKVYPDPDVLPDTDSKSPACKLCNQKKTEARDKLAPYSLSVGDPRFVVTTLLRAAWAIRDTNAANYFDTVVVMAQMPRAEAEELAAHVHTDIRNLHSATDVNSPYDRPAIDLILSEAQDGYESPNLIMQIEHGEVAPVLTPVEARSRLWNLEPNPVSTATLSCHTNSNNSSLRQCLANTMPPENSSKETCPDTDANCQTAASLLRGKLDEILPAANKDLDVLWKQCEITDKPTLKSSDRICQNTVLMQYLLSQLQRSSGADVALLKRRDFYFDRLGDEYGNYEICKTWTRETAYPSLDGKKMPAEFIDFYTKYCQLRVALDRVLWKSDNAERVMVDGATLTGLMKTAQKQADQEQTLLARDLHQEWLMTYGIVTKRPTNLVAAASGPESFSVPGSDGCDRAADPSLPPYCINGQPIIPDRAYWVIASDPVAEDQTIYTVMGALYAKYSDSVVPPQLTFLSTEIADEIFRPGKPQELRAGKHESAEANLASIETLHQNRKLIQLDINKLVAGYSMVNPSISDANLASNYSGVSNTQASTPHSQELDLEAYTRLILAPWRMGHAWLVFGAQSDAEYDRRVTDNLSGNPATITYSPNNLSAGGFTQVAFHHFLPGLSRAGINTSTRNLPRAFVVIAPYQYQRQMTGGFLRFPYFTPPSTTNSQVQLSIHNPTVMGFSQRAGVRYEGAGIIKWLDDVGSYAEIGPEYSEQNNVLAALKLPQLSTTATCAAAANQSFTTCVEAAYKAAGVSINAASIIVPITQTIHAGGFYWDAHIQKAYDKQKNYSLTFDTKGESFLLPGATLTTQTRYAFTSKLALNFKIAGNLSLSPTYTDFFFENQGISSQRTSLIATSFSIAAKWYFAHDAQVPFRKQIGFTGPASMDQTGSAKIK